MSNFIRKDEIFKFENQLYDYATLKTLRDKSKGNLFKDGEVVSEESGNIHDLSSLENFYSEAVTLDITKRLVESSTISNTEIRDINRRVITNEHKDFFNEVKSKMEDDTVSYEEVMKYWELKQLFKEFDYRYDNFIKFNTTEKSIAMIRSFSILNQGRIMMLLDLISGKNFKDNNIFIPRATLMDKLQFENNDSLRHFLSLLEKNEIIRRENKAKKLHVEFTINPFLFNKIQSVILTTTIYEKFPNSFKNFVPIDEYYYFKMLSEKQMMHFNTDI